MAEKILLHFEFDKGEDLRQAAETLQERISQFDGVDSVESVPEKPRITGLEVAAAIAVGVTVARNVREGVTELRKLVQEFKKLIKELHGVQEVKLEIGSRRLSLDQIKDSDLKELIDQDDETN